MRVFALVLLFLAGGPAWSAVVVGEAVWVSQRLGMIAIHDFEGHNILVRVPGATRCYIDMQDATTDDLKKGRQTAVWFNDTSRSAAAVHQGDLSALMAAVTTAQDVGRGSKWHGTADDEIPFLNPADLSVGDWGRFPPQDDDFHFSIRHLLGDAAIVSDSRVLKEFVLFGVDFKNRADGQRIELTDIYRVKRTKALKTVGGGETTFLMIEPESKEEQAKRVADREAKAELRHTLEQYEAREREKVRQREARQRKAEEAQREKEKRELDHKRYLAAKAVDEQMAAAKLKLCKRLEQDGLHDKATQRLKELVQDPNLADTKAAAEARRILEKK